MFNHKISGVRNFLYKLARSIQTLIGWILLSLIYILGIGPASLLGKSIGKKFLQTKPDARALTYWKEAEPSENFYRQF